jgi:hypothetical protein
MPKGLGHIIYGPHGAFRAIQWNQQFYRHGVSFTQQISKIIPPLNEIAR